jgi:hypothetical protein
LNKLVSNAKFTIEDICNIYRRLKIEAGDDSDTLSYIGFMVAILPQSVAGSTIASTRDHSPETGASPTKRSGFMRTSSTGVMMTPAGRHSRPESVNRTPVAALGEHGRSA